MLAGPGPGALLVAPAGAEAPGTLFGIPALYAWMVFWLFVMSGCVLWAAWRVWDDEEDVLEDATDSGRLKERRS